MNQLKILFITVWIKINLCNLLNFSFQVTMYTSTVTQFEEPPKKDLPVEEKDSEPEALPNEEGEQPLIWRNIIGIGILHVLAVYAFITSYQNAKFWTWIFSEYNSKNYNHSSKFMSHKTLNLFRQFRLFQNFCNFFLTIFDAADFRLFDFGNSRRWTNELIFEFCKFEKILILSEKTSQNKLKEIKLLIWV